MLDKQASSSVKDSMVESYVRGLIDKAAEIRLPELFMSDRPDALYHIANRNGVAVIALRTTSLSGRQLIKLMQYRLAQALMVRFVDAERVYEDRLRYEPFSALTPSDVHVVAAATQTGEILCYAAIRAVPQVAEGTTLRIENRPLLPVEEGHGWGIFNRLLVLPDLPLARVRELGRLIKNQRLDPLDERVVRAPVEVCAALYRLFAAGPLRLEVEAVVGTIEEGIALKNAAFFHLPIVVIHGTVPYVAEDSYVFPVYQARAEYPFAFLTSDMSVEGNPRLTAIEDALELPGKEGVRALLALKATSGITKSSLEPLEGLPPLTAAEAPQRDLSMPARRQALDVGARLRTTSLFTSLSVAEAAVLGTFMERLQVGPGEAIVRHGDEGGDLFLIEAGHAEARMRGRMGMHLDTVTLSPGEFFGEIALVTGSRRTADVVAITPMTLMKLSRADYTRYLAHMLAVDQEVARTAACRAVRRRTKAQADSE